MATYTETQKRWKKVIAEYRASGMTQKEFADKHGLGVKSVSRWHRRFDGELNLLPKERRARKSGSGEPAKAAAAPQWVAVVATDEAPRDDAEPAQPAGGDGGIHLSMGCVAIHVRPGFDETLLADVLRVVKSAC